MFRRSFHILAFAVVACAASFASLVPASAGVVTLERHDPGYMVSIDHALIGIDVSADFAAVLTPSIRQDLPSTGHQRAVTIADIDFSNASTPEVVAYRSGFAGYA